MVLFNPHKILERKLRYVFIMDLEFGSKRLFDLFKNL